jgi:hypothetical protein
MGGGRAMPQAGLQLVVLPQHLPYGRPHLGGRATALGRARRSRPRSAGAGRGDWLLLLLLLLSLLLLLRLLLMVLLLMVLLLLVLLLLLLFLLLLLLLLLLVLLLLVLLLLLLLLFLMLQLHQRLSQLKERCALTHSGVDGIRVRAQLTMALRQCRHLGAQPPDESLHIPSFWVAAGAIA